MYNVVSLDTNHLVFDPFTRQLYASVPGTAPQLQGNSIVAIDPNTGAVGMPVNIGSEPAKIAESDDGLYIYASLTGAQALARYNLTTGMADPTTYSLNPPGGAARDLAVLPASDNTLAIDMGSFTGNGIYDISNGTGTFRSKFTGPYTGSSLAFPDASHLYTKDSDTSGNEFYRWNVTADGLTAIDGSTLNGMSQFRLSNGLVYAAAGGFADPPVQETYGKDIVGRRVERHPQDVITSGQKRALLRKCGCPMVEAPGFSPARYRFSLDAASAPVPFVLAGAKARGLLRRLVAGLKPSSPPNFRPQRWAASPGDGFTPAAVAESHWAQQFEFYLPDFPAEGPYLDYTRPNCNAASL